MPTLATVVVCAAAGASYNAERPLLLRRKFATLWRFRLIDKTASAGPSGPRTLLYLDTPSASPRLGM